MELNDYPYFYLVEDGRLCSTGQHFTGFLRVLAMTGMLWSTVADCPWPTAWIGARSA
jgi:hypothetical protein